MLTDERASTVKHRQAGKENGLGNKLGSGPHET